MSPANVTFGPAWDSGWGDVRGRLEVAWSSNPRPGSRLLRRRMSVLADGTEWRRPSEPLSGARRLDGYLRQPEGRRLGCPGDVVTEEEEARLAVVADLIQQIAEHLGVEPDHPPEREAMRGLTLVRGGN
jgi:hypothetical protein